VSGTAQRTRGAVSRAHGALLVISARADALMAELLVASHLRRAGCELALDVPLPSGSSADLAVARDGQRFHAHVKWLSSRATVRAATRAGRGAAARDGAVGSVDGAPIASTLRPIPRVLRELESIPRAIEVAVRWKPGAGCAAFRRMIRQVEPFLRSARVSDERVARNAAGEEIGRVRVVGPRRGGSSLRLVDERRIERRAAAAARADRLLRKALAQFMPKSLNVIVIVGDDPEQANAIDLTLRGSIVEDWSRFPPRGERVAHGRADDGFWSRGRASASTAVAWMLASSAGRPRRRMLWLRDGAKVGPSMRALLGELFDDGCGSRDSPDERSAPRRSRAERREP